MVYDFEPVMIIIILQACIDLTKTEWFTNWVWKITMVTTDLQKMFTLLAVCMHKFMFQWDWTNDLSKPWHTVYIWISSWMKRVWCIRRKDKVCKQWHKIPLKILSYITWFYSLSLETCNRGAAVVVYWSRVLGNVWKLWLYTAFILYRKHSPYYLWHD